METIVKERAIVANVNTALLRPPAIVNLPMAISGKVQEKARQIENLPELARGILQIRLPQPPPKPAPVVHQRREEAFD
jgi:hypothetical protein